MESALVPFSSRILGQSSYKEYPDAHIHSTIYASAKGMRVGTLINLSTNQRHDDEGLWQNIQTQQRNFADKIQCTF